MVERMLLSNGTMDESVLAYACASATRRFSPIAHWAWTCATPCCSRPSRVARKYQATLAIKAATTPQVAIRTASFGIFPFTRECLPRLPAVGHSKFHDLVGHGHDDVGGGMQAPEELGERQRLVLVAVDDRDAAR